MTQVPRMVSKLITHDVAVELARAYEDAPVFPGTARIDHPDDLERAFPDWPGDVLVLAYENQGVCAWGVPLDTDDPPVLVGGDLVDLGATTVVYASSVAEFIAVRRWDALYSGNDPHIQAQASPVAPAAVSFLRRHFDEFLPTRGFPGRLQLRFSRDDVHIVLWLTDAQTDWFITAADVESLAAVLPEIVPAALAKDECWSPHPECEELLGLSSSQL